MLLALLLQVMPPIQYDTGASTAPNLPSTVIVKNRGQRPSRLHRRVGKLVAQGKCAEARTTALEAGDFALAEQAAGACGR